jgi:hypothetical protein
LVLDRPDQPELAQYGWELLREDVGYAYLATVTCDGMPRVHPVVPFVSDGRLMIKVVATSPKVADLRARAHYMLHATVGDNDTEFAVRGRASELPVEDHARVLDAQELNTVDAHEGDVIFELGIDRADAAIWDDGAPHRQTWRAPVGR